MHLWSLAHFLFAISCIVSSIAGDEEEEEHTIELDGHPGVQRTSFLLPLDPQVGRRFKRESNAVYGGQPAWAFFAMPYARPLNITTAFDLPKGWGADEIGYRDALHQRNASFRYYPKLCPQFISDRPPYRNSLPADIDCLALNIYTPRMEENITKPLMPVYVLVHGGKLVSGSSPDFGVDGLINNFVNKDIVCVTVNYRLGAYGFFDFNEDKEGHSMRGIYDLKVALEYVQQRIEGFRGDKNRVTLGGFSAGAALTSYFAYQQLANPNQEKLFHQIVLHSGVAKVSEKNGMYYDNFEEALYDQLKCTGNARECLQSFPIDTIINTTKTVSPFGVHFTPKDGDFDWVKEMKAKAKKFHADNHPNQTKLNVLLSMVPDEFYPFEKDLTSIMKRMNRTFQYDNTYIARVFILMLYNGQIVTKDHEIHEMVKHANIYLEGKEGQEDIKLAIRQFFTDYVFTRNILEEATTFKELGLNVSIYKFVYKGELDKINGQSESSDYVVHGADVRYAYQPIDPWKALMNSSYDNAKALKEAEVAHNLAAEIANFIKEGKLLTDTPFNQIKLNYLEISDKSISKNDEPLISKDRLKACNDLSQEIHEDRMGTKLPITPLTTAAGDTKTTAADDTVTTAAAG